MYNVFVRSWWKKVNGVYVPHCGRKKSLRKNVSYETALSICKNYNDTHKPGLRGRKAEFTQV